MAKTNGKLVLLNIYIHLNNDRMLQSNCKYYRQEFSQTSVIQYVA